MPAYQTTTTPLPELLRRLRQYARDVQASVPGSLGGILGLLDVAEVCLEPVTVAVRVCAQCRRYLGVVEWAGDDAHPETWTVTHGLCPDCFAASHEDAA
jgi:hypothetical protein